MIYIITAVHNRKSITSDFIDAILAQTEKDVQLVLVDDGSTDHTAEMVKEKMPGAVILFGNGRLFWGGGLHMAYKYLKKHPPKTDDIILITNDDIQFPADFLEKGKQLVLAHPNNLISAQRFIKERPEKPGNAVFQRNPVTGRGVRCAPGVPGNYTSTKALFMRAEVYFAIGGMHPFLIPHYCSDDEYTLRAARKGFLSLSGEDLMFTAEESTFVQEMEARAKEGRKMTLRERFRKNSPRNPFYRFNYIILVTPIHLLPAYIAHKLFRSGR